MDRNLTATLLLAGVGVVAVAGLTVALDGNEGPSTTAVVAKAAPVASEVHDLLVKTHPADVGKIELIKELVWEHLQMDRFLEVAAEARFD